MADAVLIEVADAIAAELNTASAAGTFNRTFDARVLWANRTIFLEDLNVLHVDVAPIGWTRSIKTRGSHRHVLRYHVGIRKRFDTSDQGPESVPSDDEVGDLVTLITDIMGYFMPKGSGHQGRQLTDATDANWVPERTGETDAFIRWEDLDKFQFSGFFPLTYEVARTS